MLEKSIEIINKLGLHARAAAKLTAVAARYSCTIQITKEQRTIDAKSIMAVMMLAASKGTWITLMTDGEDESEAMAALEELINNRFDEGE